ERIVFNVAPNRERPSGQSRSAHLLIYVVLTAEVGAFRRAVAGFDRDAPAQLALDGEVPALQVRRRRIYFKPVRGGDSRRLGQQRRERIGDGERVRIAGGTGEGLRDRIRESAGQIGADRAEPGPGVEDAVATPHYGSVVAERPPGEAHARRDVVIVRAY